MEELHTIMTNSIKQLTTKKSWVDAVEDSLKMKVIRIWESEAKAAHLQDQLMETEGNKC